MTLTKEQKENLGLTLILVLGLGLTWLLIPSGV